MKKIYIEENLCTVYKLVVHKMQRILFKNGFALAETPEEADVLLAGVCAAFDADEERSVEIVKKLWNVGKPLYTYGCMTQVNPAAFESKHLYASWETDRLIDVLTQWQVEYVPGPLPTEFRRAEDYRVHNPKKRFIAISTGCSYACSYCPHKIGAGPLVSIPIESVLAEVQEAVAAGADTLVLTGIDTACYGSDIGTTFYDLLYEILRQTKDSIKVHIAQFNPEGLFDDGHYSGRLATLFQNTRIKDIQIPIQSASPRILDLMNRFCPIDTFGPLLAQIKQANPGVMLRTDIMVGFPCENPKDLDKTIDFAIKHFSEVAIYKFELKQGTHIANTGLPQCKDAPERLRYAKDRLRKARLLVHSGGQDVSGLLENDKIKEANR